MSSLLKSLRLCFQPKSALAWRNASPTTLVRSIDALESFYVGTGSFNVPLGRRHLDITVVAKMGVKAGTDRPTAAQAREAWTALRRRHPAMASVIEGSQRVYRRMDEHERQTWLEETFVAVPSEHAPKAGVTPELLHRYSATTRPTLYFLEESLSFALRVPHSSMDALGACSLVDEFLTGLVRVMTEKQECQDQAEDGWDTTQPKDLASCFKEAANSTFPTPTQLWKLWRMYQHWVKSYPSIGIRPDQSERHQAGMSVWKDLKFSADETSMLVSRAKQKGLSVTHAVHAALILAAKGQCNDPELSTYTNAIVMNMRGRAGNKNQDITAAHHAIWFFSISVSDDFESVANQMKDVYLSAANDPDLLPLTGPVFAEGERALPSNAHHSWSSPFVSSCGKVDGLIKAEYGPFCVEDISVVAEAAHEHVIVAFWSFGGKLMVRVLYNDGFYKESTIQRYIDSTEKVMRGGLGMSDSK